MGIMIHDSLDCVKGLRRKGLQPPSRFDKDLPGTKHVQGDKNLWSYSFAKRFTRPSSAKL